MMEVGLWMENKESLYNSSLCKTSYQETTWLWFISRTYEWFVWHYLYRCFRVETSLVQTSTSTLLYWQFLWKIMPHHNFSTLIFCTERTWRTCLIKTISRAISQMLDLNFLFLLWLQAHEYSNISYEGHTMPMLISAIMMDACCVQ